MYSYELSGQVHTELLYPGENSPRHPLHRRLGENPNRNGDGGREKSLSYLKIKCQFSGHSAHNPVSIVTKVGLLSTYAPVKGPGISFFITTWRKVLRPLQPSIQCVPLALTKY